MFQIRDKNGFLLFSTSDWFGIIDICLMQYYTPLNFNLTINGNQININDEILTITYHDIPSERSNQ